MLAQSSGSAHLLNNKLASNSVSAGRVEPEDTEPLFLHFGLPAQLKVALKSLGDGHCDLSQLQVWLQPWVCSISMPATATLRDIGHRPQKGNRLGQPGVHGNPQGFAFGTIMCFGKLGTPSGCFEVPA